MRQFTFMQILYEDGFPTPKPIDTNRHAIVMSLIDGDPLCHIRKIGEQCSVKQIFQKSLSLACKFASRGLIHGDFNEFNLLINNTGDLTVIDFPQCISSKHVNGEEYFNRDIECLYTFFDRMMKKCRREDQDGMVLINQSDVDFDVSSIPMPVLQEIKVQKRLDLEVKARGHFKLSEEKQLDQFLEEWNDCKNLEKEETQSSPEDKEDNEDEFENEEYQKQQVQIHIENAITEIEQIKAEQDREMQELMCALEQLDASEKDSPMVVEKSNEGKELEQDNSNSDESEEEEEGGPTAYQIRQKLKQQRKEERRKKKQEISTSAYIKKALHKKAPERRQIPKGNYGAKRKTKSKAQSIKDGLEMGW